MRGLWSSALLAVTFTACSSPEPAAEPSASPVGAFSADKAALYGLVGRWYMPSEVQRLMDPTLTPEAWCAREPARLFVYPDKLELTCPDGRAHGGAISTVTATASRGVSVVLRAPKDSQLRRVEFLRIRGTQVDVAGLPCTPKVETHVRFPEYELLARQILGGRRCAQILAPHGGTEG